VQASRKWIHRGEIGLHYLNSATSETLTAFDPNADALGVGAPSGTSASAIGSLHARQSEFGGDWTSRSGAWNVSYRQLWAPVTVGGSYEGQYLFFSEGQSGSTGFDRLDLGVLGCAYTTRLGSGNLTFKLQQLVPYAIKSAGSLVTIGGSGGNGGSGSTSTGGTALTISFSVPTKGS
jgi:hypothetical protein